MKSLRFTIYILTLVFVFPNQVGALSSLPLSTMQNVVMVICDDRQGSGAVINAEAGYVLTAGHVVINTEGSREVGDCSVGFMKDLSLTVAGRYAAEVVHANFDDAKETDFAILKIGRKVAGTQVGPVTGFFSYEFAEIGDKVSVLGFPASGEGGMRFSEGVITGFNRGLVETSAEIEGGFSGGPVVHDNLGIIGVASRIVRFYNEETEEEEGEVIYMMNDILPVINWLDIVGSDSGGHDEYLQHADVHRYQSQPVHIRDEGLGCSNLVRTPQSSSVYCFVIDGRRLVFTNESVFRSWYDNFSEVFVVDAETMSSFQLVGAVNYAPGTLIKITTDPKVYYVADANGTIRWLKTEDVAERIAGEDWSKKVFDVDDSYFINYTTGAPIQ